MQRRQNYEKKNETVFQQHEQHYSYYRRRNYRLRDGWLLLLRLLNQKRFLRPLQGSQPGEVFLFTAIWSLKMMKKIRENKNQKAAQSVSVSSAVVSLAALLLAPVSVLALVIPVILIQIIIIPIESSGMV